jgi:hypothetical protein
MSDLDDILKHVPKLDSAAPAPPSSKPKTGISDLESILGDVPKVEPAYKWEQDDPGWFTRFQRMTQDPGKVSANATQALADAAIHGITPSQAMRLRREIDKGTKIDPARAQLRATATDLVKLNLERGYGQVNQGLWGAEALINGDRPEYWRAIEQTEAVMPKDEDMPYPETAFQDMVGSAAEIFPFMAESAKRGAWRGMILAGGTGLIGAATKIPVQHLMPAMYAVGQTSASLEFVGKVEGGLAYVDMAKYKDPETGEQINRNVARAAAFGVGVINGALEYAQLRTLAKTFPGGERMIRGLINDTIIEIVQDGTLKKLLASKVLEYGTTVVKETTQELAQESTNVVAETLARKITNALEGTDMKADDIEQIAQRFADVIKTSAQGFAVIGAAGPIVSIAKNRYDQRKASRAASERTERARRVFAATVYDQVRSAQEGAQERMLDIDPEELKTYIENPEASSISDEDLDAIIGDEDTEDELIDALLRQAGFDVDGDLREGGPPGPGSGGSVPADLGDVKREGPTVIGRRLSRMWRDREGIQRELQNIFGTYEELDALEAQGSTDPRLLLADKYMADLEEAATNADWFEAEKLMTQLANDIESGSTATRSRTRRWTICGSGSGNSSALLPAGARFRRPSEM